MIAIKSKKIYLMGGLGNVLFQLNYFYNLRAHGLSVKADSTLLRSNYFAKRILRWSDHQTLDILSDLQLSDDIDVNSDGYKYILAGGLAKFIGRDILTARYCGLAAPALNDLTAGHFFGYFHENNPVNQLFVEKIRGGILRRLISAELAHVREFLNTIGDNFVVHIRGGDYTRDAAFTIPGDYYKKALSGQQKCYIVTNDKDFSRSIFKNIEMDYEFLGTRNSLDDFIMLALCKNKVLANSTFSWWAAEVGSPDSNIIQREPFYSHVDWRPYTNQRRKIIEV